MSILKELKDKRIVKFEVIENNDFFVTEMCDEHYYCEMSRNELLQLANELVELANK